MLTPRARGSKALPQPQGRVSPSNLGSSGLRGPERGHARTRQRPLGVADTWRDKVNPPKTSTPCTGVFLEHAGPLTIARPHPWNCERVTSPGGGTLQMRFRLGALGQRGHPAPSPILTRVLIGGGGGPRRSGDGTAASKSQRR